MQDPVLWSTEMAKLMKVILEVSPHHSVPDSQMLSDSVKDICEISLTRNIFDEVVKDPKAIEALKNLDIEAGDYCYLSDILDPDNTGDVSMPELVDGIQRLRGHPRRSDIVCVDLMIRSTQVALDRIAENVNFLRDDVSTMMASNLAPMSGIDTSSARDVVVQRL